MNALTKPNDQLPLETPQRGEIVRADSSAVMDAIMRAAADPNMDADKLERMLGMYERISAQTAKVAYSAAIAQVQPLLPVIDRRGKTDKAKYALWEDINDAIRPVLAENGFALSFKIGNAGEKVSVTGILSHRDGHSEEATFVLQADTSGSKNAVQAMGSSLSYAKRYIALGLLNITTRGEDDDGAAGGSKGAREQSAAVNAAISAINLCEGLADLRSWKVKNAAAIQALPSAEQDAIIRLFNQRVANLKGDPS